MKELVLGGIAGLALGIVCQRLRLHRRAALREAVGLLEPELLRCLLLTVGFGAMLTSLMMWLAVIDVDTVTVPPLDGGTLLGGVIFGAALGWSGMAPATSGVILGADRLLEGLCAVAGCAAGAFVLPYAEKVFPVLRSWLDGGAATWFQVTLDESWLFSGGFLGQGCVGLVMIAAALCVRRPLVSDPEPEPASPAPDISAEPDDVQEETFVALLPGEEPVVVDTAADDPPPAESADKHQEK